MVAAARGADGFEQVVKGHEIDAVAFLEIGLSFARDDRREMENHVRLTGHQPEAGILARNVERVRVDLAGKSRRMVRRHHIDQRELVDGLAVKASVADEAPGELASDHAGRAGDENVHWLIPLSLWRGLH